MSVDCEVGAGNPLWKPQAGAGIVVSGIGLSIVTLGAGISFSSSLTKRASSSLTAGFGAGKASDFSGNMDLSIIPKLAAS